LNRRLSGYDDYSVQRADKFFRSSPPRNGWTALSL